MNEKLRGGEDNSGGGRAPAQTRRCERAEELVAYLYGEAGPSEAASLSRHLDACAPCREELAAFGVVRAGLAEWRAEAHEAVAPSFAFKPDAVGEAAPAVRAPEPARRRRSALAALHAFFTLSPRWLQAGAVAATVLVCALAALAAARAEVSWDERGLAFRAGVPERVVERVVEKRADASATVGPTQEQVEALVAERVESARREFEAEKDKAVAAAVAEATKGAPRVVVASAPAPRPQRRARPANDGPNRNRQPEARLRDDDLPRLSDLLNAVN